jgi:DNA recombination protein RmuC
MSEIAVVAIIILLLLVLGAMLYYGFHNRQEMDEIKAMQKNNQALEMMQQQMESLREQVNKQLGSVNKQLLDATGQIGNRLDSASQMIGNVHKSLGELGEASKQIYDIGKDISSLQNILQPPKLRGILGEVFLEELLRQLVPTNCAFQHRFRSGEAVDGIITIGERFVPVDAKFPLENFRKFLDEEVDEKFKAKCRKAFAADVKRHIDKIASKYILPDEGTYDFALMYIPAENVYYEIITKEQKDESSISEYALQKRVIPVSPNTIYAYLQVIIFGLKGLQVEKHAEEIIHHLARLENDFAGFNDDFGVLGTHIANAAKKYQDSEKKLSRFADKLSATSEATGDELGAGDQKSLVAVQKPEEEEDQG